MVGGCDDVFGRAEMLPTIEILDCIESRDGNFDEFAEDEDQDRQELYALIGITESNTTFVNLSIADSTVALEDKQIDAAFFLLSAKTPVIKRLNSRIGLQLIGIEEAEALSHKISHLERVIIPKGAFEIRSLRPGKDIETVALPVTMIVGKEAGDAF